MVDGLWSMDHDIGFRIYGSGSRLRGLQFMVHGSFEGTDLGIRVEGL